MFVFWGTLWVCSRNTVLVSNMSNDFCLTHNAGEHLVIHIGINIPFRKSVETNLRWFERNLKHIMDKMQAHQQKQTPDIQTHPEKVF